MRKASWRREELVSPVSTMSKAAACMDQKQCVALMDMLEGRVPTSATLLQRDGTKKIAVETFLVC